MRPDTEWQAMAEGAYSAEYAACAESRWRDLPGVLRIRGEPYLPADPKTIRAFIEDRVKAGKKPATVKRYVATIARVHIARGSIQSLLE